MKKIIQYSLCALMASGFTVTNAVDHSMPADRSVQSETTPNMEALQIEIIASQDVVSGSYKQIFSEDSEILFQNMDSETNADAVDIVRDFIIKVAHLSDCCVHSVCKTIGKTNKSLSELALATHFLQSFGVNGVGDKIKTWSTYGVIAKILNSSTNTDVLKDLFKEPRCIAYNNQFNTADSEVYNKQLKVINELLKTGLIGYLYIKVPFQNSGILFNTLELNNSVSKVCFYGNGGSPFDIAETLPCLNSTDQLETVTFENAFLTNESEFLEFLKAHQVTHFECFNVDLTSKCDSDNFYAMFKETPIKELKFCLSKRKGLDGALQLSRNLPRSLEKLDINLFEAGKATLISIAEDVLSYCPEIKSLSLRNYPKDHLSHKRIDRLSSYASQYSNLQTLTVNGSKIPLDKKVPQVISLVGMWWRYIFAPQASAQTQKTKNSTTNRQRRHRRSLSAGW